MSMMDKLKSMMKGHDDQVRKGVDKAGNTIDDRTKGKHRGQVDTAQDKLKQRMGDHDDRGRQR